MSFRYSMVFQKPFFSERPEPFKSVNMPFAISKIITMINRNMFTKKLQRFIRSELICIEYTTFFSMLYYLIHQCFCRHIINQCCVYFSVPFKHTKNCYFSFRTATTSTFALTTEVTLITFNLSGKLIKFFLQIQKYFITIRQLADIFFSLYRNYIQNLCVLYSLESQD